MPRWEQGRAGCFPLPTTTCGQPMHVHGHRGAAAARAGQKHPLFATTSMLCPASAANPCSSRRLREPLPVHCARALQVVRVADQLVQDANNLGEAWPLAAVLLPAIQHELVQGCGAAHGGRQAVAFLHGVNDLEGTTCRSGVTPPPNSSTMRGRSLVHELLGPSGGEAGRVCTRSMLNDKRSGVQSLWRAGSRLDATCVREITAMTAGLRGPTG